MRRRRRARKRRQGCEAPVRSPTMHACSKSHRESFVGAVRRITASSAKVRPAVAPARRVLQLQLAVQTSKQRCKRQERRTRRGRACEMRASAAPSCCCRFPGLVHHSVLMIELKRHNQLSEAGGSACRQLGRRRRRTARLPVPSAMHPLWLALFRRSQPSCIAA